LVYVNHDLHFVYQRKETGMLKRAMMLVLPMLGIFAGGCDAATMEYLGLGAAVVGGIISITQFVLQGLGIE
jgi:hypothetical protein